MVLTVFKGAAIEGRRENTGISLRNRQESPTSPVNIPVSSETHTERGLPQTAFTVLILERNDTKNPAIAIFLRLGVSESGLENALPGFLTTGISFPSESRFADYY